MRPALVDRRFSALGHTSGPLRDVGGRRYGSPPTVPTGISCVLDVNYISPWRCLTRSSGTRLSLRAIARPARTSSASGAAACNAWLAGNPRLP